MRRTERTARLDGDNSISLTTVQYLRWKSLHWYWKIGRSHVTCHVPSLLCSTEWHCSSSAYCNLSVTKIALFIVSMRSLSPIKLPWDGGEQRLDKIQCDLIGFDKVDNSMHIDLWNRPVSITHDCLVSLHWTTGNSLFWVSRHSSPPHWDLYQQVLHREPKRERECMREREREWERVWERVREREWERYKSCDE